MRRRILTAVVGQAIVPAGGCASFDGTPHPVAAIDDAVTPLPGDAVVAAIRDVSADAPSAGSDRAMKFLPPTGVAAGRARIVSDARGACGQGRIR